MIWGWYPTAPRFFKLDLDVDVSSFPCFFTATSTEDAKRSSGADDVKKAPNEKFKQLEALAKSAF